MGIVTTVGGQVAPLPGAAPAPPRGHLVQSADHALRLVRAVAQRGSIRVAEAAELLGVVPSTAHRLLATLGHQGFVVQERRGGAYLPGPAIAELTARGGPAIDLGVVSRPALEWLRDQTGETASLLVLERDEVRFVASIDGSSALRVTARPGVVLPAHCTSGGKVLLAALEREDLLDRYRDERLDGLSPRSISSRAQLEIELEEVRRRGYATNVEEGDAGICGIAVAVRSPGGPGAVAAVCLAAPIARLRTKRTAAAAVPVLRSARDQLEAALAGGPPIGPG